MSFNLSQLTRVSVLTVSALTLSVLAGCSNGDFRGASQSASDDTEGVGDFLGLKHKEISKEPKRSFDSYYGTPKKVSYSGPTGPKIVRKVTHTPFKASAPTRYVVKKGDTLWGISNKFLKNPAYWPEVWDKNQKVRNPHLIFPGDVLFIHQGPSKRGGSKTSVVEKMIPCHLPNKN